ncbi:MAG: CoA transferase [Euryarchaeota archaeon]|nr:CoA transferase [Euryarchaeota archaeon]
MGGVLEGLRVLDFTRVIAGSWCTMYLSDMGAEVLKVESPGTGDVMRLQTPVRNGECGFFIIYNRGKKSITLDLKKDEAKQLVRELVKSCDVLVENFSPGTMKELGLDYDAMRKINPKLVYASISGYGQYGPKADLPSYDVCIQAVCGLMSMNGYRGQDPLRIGMSATDFMAGTVTALAIMGALWNIRKTGKGQYIDISLFDCGLTMLENAVPKYSWTGEVAAALGSRHPSAAPHNVYKTKDGFIVIITIENKAYARLCKAMGVPELVEDPRFSEVSGRLRNVDELDAIVNSWTGKLPTARVVEALKAANLAYGVVRDVRENVEDEHSKVRNMMPTVVQPRAGPVTIPGCPIHYSETEIAPLRPAPLLGEHTEEIVTRILKYPKERYAELQKKGVF